MIFIFFCIAFQQMGYRFTPTFVQNLLAKYDSRTRKLTLDNFIVACVQIKRLTGKLQKQYFLLIYLDLNTFLNIYSASLIYLLFLQMASAHEIVKCRDRQLYNMRISLVWLWEFTNKEIYKSSALCISILLYLTYKNSYDNQTVPNILYFYGLNTFLIIIKNDLF